MFLTLMSLFIIVSIVGIILYEILSPFGMNSAHTRLWKSARLACGTQVDFIVALNHFESPAKSFKFLRDIGYETLTWSNFEDLFFQPKSRLDFGAHYVISEPSGDQRGIWIVTPERDLRNPEKRHFHTLRINSLADIKGCHICVKKMDKVSILGVLKGMYGMVRSSD